MKIYRYSNDYIDTSKRGKIAHVVFKIGKRWVSFDRAGMMGWTGKRNFFFIYSTFLNKNRAF